MAHESDLINLIKLILNPNFRLIAKYVGVHIKSNMRRWRRRWIVNSGQSRVDKLTLYFNKALFRTEFIFSGFKTNSGNA